MTALPASPDLYWLPPRPDDWKSRVRGFADRVGEGRVAEAVALARYRLDFSATNALDQFVCRHLTGGMPAEGALPVVRVALLSSSTSKHLHAGICVGLLRRGLAGVVYEPDYGQYRQALADPNTELAAFGPDFVIVAVDAATVAAHARGARDGAEARRLAEDYVAGLRPLWASARERTGAVVVQQTVMPRLADVGGSNAHRVPGSAAAFVARVNGLLRDHAEQAGIDLLALDARVAQDGLDRWFAASAWHSARQEVMLPGVPMYGDMVARLVAARKGLSAKCCVFDLDNTLWGGVVGDDGVDGIVIGQGSAAGEAFLDVQNLALDLRRRGILLAVCSKNDAANALEPFERHPDMALRRGDIASFVANWDDKATNLRRIAESLSIGLNALVFVDDNPFERALVRTTLPEVFVPELPDDIALAARCLADAGCFETVAFTAEDAARAELYAANAVRQTSRAAATDLDAYLRDLDMTLHWGAIRDTDLVRVTQLINKTNQFNLTTRRLSEAEVRAIVADPRAAGLQFRLLDRFGDNGLIAVVTGHLDDDGTFRIDDWLMSCRVLGRQVEAATLDAVVAVARRLGAARIAGRYRPTGKNGMVADLLPRLGFAPADGVAEDGTYLLDLRAFSGHTPPITSEEQPDA